MVRKGRKKKGGGEGTIMEQMTKGASQWKQGIQTGISKGKEKAAEAQAGIASGQQAYQKKISDEKIRRQMVAGEYSQMTKDLLRKNIPPKSSFAYTRQKQREAAVQGASTAYSNPNPALSPLKRKRVGIGGKRRKTRRKSRKKRKTKRKKRRRKRKTKKRRKSRR